MCCLPVGGRGAGVPARQRRAVEGCRGLSRKLRVLDLFSGIGGFSLGLERTGGFETVAFCEIEDFPRRVLAKHWPEVPCYHDVRELSAERLAADGIAGIDVITGGFPCQDISVAAYAHGRAGVDGSRTGLFREAVSLVDELGPQFVILENVIGLLVDGLVPVLQGLCTIGYDAEWHCIPASAVGAIQNRDRIWIVAYPSEKRIPRLFKSGSLGAAGQGWPCRQEDLREVYTSPFDGSRWPQPLIRRGDGRLPDWVDRIRSLGNSVVPQIPEMIGYAILEAMSEQDAP